MANLRNRIPSVDLFARAHDCIAQHVLTGDRVVAALSGGADSVLLLHLLNGLSGSLGFGLSALHVNHGVSPNANRWQKFCEKQCADLGIRLDVKRVEVKRDSGLGLEAAARMARYTAFAEVDAKWLVLAHHREDQAETLLLNLMRGAGVAGASAMPAVRAISASCGLRILRPLLDTPRLEITSYLRAQGLGWVEDESNDDATYSRNFLRHRIFPLLRERFPACDAVLARAASHFSECANLLEDLARHDARTATRDGRIIVSRLAAMDDARARNLMRLILHYEGIAAPDNARLHEIVRQVCNAASDRHLSFRFKEKSLHRYRDEVWFVPVVEEGTEKEWRGEDWLQWCGSSLIFKLAVGAGISRKKLANDRVKISGRRGGERLQPDGRRPRRELKKLLQERAVPPWERGRIPLLWCGDQLVWAAGVGIDCAWQCEAGEEGILPEYPAALPVS